MKITFSLYCISTSLKSSYPKTNLSHIHHNAIIVFLRVGRKWHVFQGCQQKSGRPRSHCADMLRPFRQVISAKTWVYVGYIAFVIAWISCLNISYYSPFTSLHLFASNLIINNLNASTNIFLGLSFFTPSPVIHFAHSKTMMLKIWIVKPHQIRKKNVNLANSLL